MKIYMMTDMEGVCGVINHDDWVVPSGRYYEQGRKLLTLEVNAAVEGFFQAGASEVMVVDGHGHGGVNHLLLDSRTVFSRGWHGPYPFGLDETFDVIAFIGQHAKAGTPFAHLAHTNSFAIQDCVINRLSVGEFGEMVLLGSTLGIPAIFASGDKALTLEAGNLVPGIETVAVKVGVNPCRGDHETAEAYAQMNLGAVHLHPEQARAKIRSGAETALKRFLDDRLRFRLVELLPPYTRSIQYRACSVTPAYTTVHDNQPDLTALLNMR